MKINSNKIGLKAIVAFIFLLTLTLSLGKNQKGSWNFTSMATAQEWVEDGEYDNGEVLEEIPEESGSGIYDDLMFPNFILKKLKCYKLWVYEDAEGNEIDFEVTQGTKLQCFPKSAARCNTSLETSCRAPKPIR